MLSAVRLRELFVYDEQTGNFFNRIDRGRARAGKLAGCPNSEYYIVIRVDSVLHSVQRLAWLYVTGEWPLGLVDHKDGNRWNNKFDNLRDISHQWNAQNEKQPRSTNKLRTQGVIQKGTKRYVAAISIDGKTKYLGTFRTKSQARSVSRAAKILYHDGFISHE